MFFRQLGLMGLTGFSLSTLRCFDFCLVMLRSKSVFVLDFGFVFAATISLTRTAAASVAGVRQNHQAETVSTEHRDFAQKKFHC